MSLPAKVALLPVLVAQAVLTRRRLPRIDEPAGDRRGVDGSGSRVLRLLVGGDSSAAGVGVRHQRDALAGHVARTLGEHGFRVHWRLEARSGLNSAQALDFLRQAHAEEPIEADVAVLATGVNDVIDQVPSHRAVRSREHTANWLRNACGVRHVVFSPVPPIHEFPGLPQPLRWIAGADARRHDAALARWAGTRNDVSHVPIELRLNSGVMAADGFHPGEPVYRVCGSEIAHHIATRVWPRIEEEEQ